MTVHTTGLLRRVAAGGAVLALVGTGVVTGAGAAHAQDATPSCAGVTAPGDGDGPLVKSFVSVTAGGTGEYTIVYRLDSDRPAGEYRVRDCAYVDTGEPGYDGEPYVGTTDERETTFTATPDGSTATFTQVVTGVDPGEEVCDRAAVSGVEGDADFTDKSNTLCITPDNPPVVPEAPYALALPLAAAGALGLVLWFRRRQGEGALPGATA